MSDGDRLRDQLVRHEGLRLKPYVDTVGKLTIGVGRNLDDVGIFTEEAMYMLTGDITRATRGLVTRYPHWFPALDPVRQAVVVNMGFNLGLSRLARFVRTLGSIERGEYARAADEMLESTWARQVGARARELSDQMKTGTWQL